MTTENNTAATIARVIFNSTTAIIAKSAAVAPTGRRFAEINQAYGSRRLDVRVDGPGRIEIAIVIAERGGVVTNSSTLSAWSTSSESLAEAVDRLHAQAKFALDVEAAAANIATMMEAVAASGVTFAEVMDELEGLIDDATGGVGRF